MNNHKNNSVNMALIATCLLLTFSGNSNASERKYGEWSVPENLGSIVNSTARDGCQTLSRDGLSLYFASDRDTGSDMNLYVAERSSTSEPFGAGQTLGAINAAGADDICPSLSYDGHTLFFASTRSGGCGSRDLWVAHRHDARDHTGWGTAINLGCTVNSSGVDQGPSFYEDANEQKFVLFSSNRSQSNPDFAGHNIYSMKLFTDGTPDESTLHIVSELSTTSHDHRPHVTKNGKEVLLDSNRNGASTGWDIWSASRESADVPFSPPVPLTQVNSVKNDVRAVMSADGSELYFTSNRAGGFGKIDVYRSTRSKKNDEYSEE